MMLSKTTKRKIAAVGLRGLSVAVAGSVPIWLIAQKFPLWVTEQPASVSMTGAGLAVVILAVMILWKKIFLALKPLWQKMKKMRGVVLGTVLVSGGILFLCFAVRQVLPILPDIETICTGGIVSGLGGVGLDVAASSVYPAKVKEEGTKEEAKEV